jgi:predicted membrane-bound mannosyltransferase
MRPVLLAAAAVLVAATAACANQQQLPTTGLPTVLPTTSKAAPSTSSATSPSTTSAAAATTPATSGTVVYKVTGSGTALTIDWTPADAAGAGDRKQSVPLPWTKEVPDAGTASVYEVVVIGGDNVGCQIVRGGKVVAEEPAGGSGHCVFKP